MAVSSCDRSCVEVGDIRMVRFLLQSQDKSDIKKIPFYEGFNRAIQLGNEEIAILLIEASWQITEKDIMNALEKRSMVLLQAMLKTNVVDTSRMRFSPVVQAAIEWGDYQAIQDVILAGADVNHNQLHREYHAPLTMAVQRRDMILVKLLLHSGANMNLSDVDDSVLRGETTRTALAAAIVNGDIEMIRFLFKNGADPGDSEALFQATFRSNEIIHILLQEFANRYPHGKRHYGSAALKSMVRKGDLSSIKAIGEKADLCCSKDHINPKRNKTTKGEGFAEEYGQTPLGSAIVKDQGMSLEEARMLLKLGADPNSAGHPEPSSDMSNSPLSLAVGTKSIEMVKLLLEFGAKVNLPAAGPFGRTPLQKAAEVGSFELVEYFLDLGADVNAAPARNSGGTALQFAAIKGYVGIATFLLKKGADVNGPGANINGRTALKSTAEWGRIDVVKLLLGTGAIVEGSSRWRFRSAIRRAEENGHIATANLLKTYERPGEELPDTAVPIGGEDEPWWGIETEEGFEPWTGEAPVG